MKAVIVGYRKKTHPMIIWNTQNECYKLYDLKVYIVFNFGKMFGLIKGVGSAASGFLGGFWVKFAFIVIAVIGIGSFGAYIGYHIGDACANKEAAAVFSEKLVAAQEYNTAIKILQDKQHDLRSKLNEALAKNSDVVTKYITRKIGRKYMTVRKNINAKSHQQ